VQRAKDMNPDGIFVFVPGGVQPAALGKTMSSAASIRARRGSWGRASSPTTALKSMGDAALGIITVFHYDWNHNSANEPGFREGVQRGLRRAQSGPVLDRGLGRHAPHLRSPEEDRRQDRR